MKREKKQHVLRFRWFFVLLAQAACTLAAGILISLSIIPGGVFYAICLWGLMPVLGFISACIATRKGLLNYAAWIVPPAMEILANHILWGYSPSVGPVFLCAFISLVGAATGEVLKRQYKR